MYYPETRITIAVGESAGICGNFRESAGIRFREKGKKGGVKPEGASRKIPLIGWMGLSQNGLLPI